MQGEVSEMNEAVLDCCVSGDPAGLFPTQVGREGKLGQVREKLGKVACFAGLEAAGDQRRNATHQDLVADFDTGTGGPLSGRSVSASICIVSR
jgi:hypothetical protein